MAISVSKIAPNPFRKNQVYKGGRGGEGYLLFAKNNKGSNTHFLLHY